MPDAPPEHRQLAAIVFTDMVDYSALAQRVLGMPNKRYTRRPIEFLTRVEVEALLAAPVLDNWTGRRDHAMLLPAVQTGLRAAELIGLRIHTKHLSQCEMVAVGTSTAPHEVLIIESVEAIDMSALASRSQPPWNGRNCSTASARTPSPCGGDDTPLAGTTFLSGLPKLQGLLPPAELLMTKIGDCGVSWSRKARCAVSPSMGVAVPSQALAGFRRAGLG